MAGSCVCSGVMAPIMCIVRCLVDVTHWDLCGTWRATHLPLRPSHLAAHKWACIQADGLHYLQAPQHVAYALCCIKAASCSAHASMHLPHAQHTAMPMRAVSGAGSFIQLLMQLRTSSDTALTLTTALIAWNRLAHAMQPLWWSRNAFGSLNVSI